MKKYIVTLLVLTFLSINIFAQNNVPRLSPKAYVGQMVGYVNVEINYGSPGTNDRDVWGKLVPYDEVWRTGANEATTIEFSKSILIEGNKIPAGKYSLFTIPGNKEWTIILNKISEQWGAFKYNKDEDIIRFNVTPISNTYNERLKFNIDYVAAYKSNVVLEWEKLKIVFGLDSRLSKLKE
jgi:hypothetical protein